MSGSQIKEVNMIDFTLTFVAATYHGKPDAANKILKDIASVLQSGLAGLATRPELADLCLEIAARVLLKLSEQNRALSVLNTNAAKTRGTRLDRDLRDVFNTVQQKHKQGRALSDDQAFADVSDELHKAVSSVKRHYYEQKSNLGDWANTGGQLMSLTYFVAGFAAALQDESVIDEMVSEYNKDHDREISQHIVDLMHDQYGRQRKLFKSIMGPEGPKEEDLTTKERIRLYQAISDRQAKILSSPEFWEDWRAREG